jgi:UDP-N-acetylmuramoyl-tripeptide--D-alanyl-D-alanine ligase
LLLPFSSIKLATVAAALGADLDPAFNDVSFGPVITDSRNIVPGDWFLALRGEKFDGHEFTARALELGAAGLIVEQQATLPTAVTQREGLPILRVADTLKAWGDLAAAQRLAWAGPVLALSGSAGKTTTRRLIASALNRHLRTLEPIRNYNNLIGLPHTLLRLENETDIAIIELGMNMPGELARLTQIAQPSVAAITQIGLAHVGMFESPQALVNAELEVFENAPAGIPFVANAACPNTMRHITKYASPAGGNHPVVLFLGEKPAEIDAPPAVRILNVTPLPGGVPRGYRFDLELPGGKLRGQELHLFGRHHLENVAAACAVLLAAGLEPTWVAEALEDFDTEQNRGQIIETPHRVIQVLDCYNASPPAMLSALRSLGDFPCPDEDSGVQRRVLVLADMLELGRLSTQLHDFLLPMLRELAPAGFFALGPNMSRLAATLAAEGLNAQGCATREELLPALQAFVQPGDLVFFKGSHSFALEKVAQGLG